MRLSVSTLLLLVVGIDAAPVHAQPLASGWRVVVAGPALFTVSPSSVGNQPNSLTLANYRFHMIADEEFDILGTMSVECPWQPGGYTNRTVHWLASDRGDTLPRARTPAPTTVRHRAFTWWINTRVAERLVCGSSLTGAQQRLVVPDSIVRRHADFKALAADLAARGFDHRMLTAPQIREFLACMSLLSGLGIRRVDGPDLQFPLQLVAGASGAGDGSPVGVAMAAVNTEAGMAAALGVSNVAALEDAAARNRVAAHCNTTIDSTAARTRNLLTAP